MMRVLAILVGAVLLLAAPARGQWLPDAEDAPEWVRPPRATAPATGSSPSLVMAPPSMNPLSVMADAANLLPRQGGAASGTGGAGEGPKGLSTVLNIMLMLTVLALAPSILLMTTCFVRIVVVLALLRQAIGTQNLPPPQVTIALALFMTMLVMAPTAQRVYDDAIVPYQQGVVTDYDTLWSRAKQPLRDFMFEQIEATGNWSSLYMVMEYRGIDTSRPETLTRADADMVTLIPAFMLSELKTSFLMGFRIYLPFLVIDMVISTMLISMSMMMLPPVLISLPFKMLLFVLVDGWALVVGNLMGSFRQPAPEAVAAVLQLTGFA
jgi:flagellar biosynthetic protein FliP